MISALFSALSARSVSAVLLAVGVGVAYVSRGPIDLEAIELLQARQPAPQSQVELSGFRFPPSRTSIPSRANPGSSRVGILSRSTPGERTPTWSNATARGPRRS